MANPKHRWRILTRLSIVLIPVVLILMVRAFPGTYQSLSTNVFDLMQRAAPYVPQNSPVSIVAIDDESLKRLGQWPWPRTLMAKIVDTLREAGAQVVVMDILYSEPDHMSALELLPFMTQSGTPPDVAQNALTTVANSDQRLAEAIAKVPTVLALALGDRGGRVSIRSKAGFASVANGTGDPGRDVWSYPQAIAPIGVLEAAAAGQGAISMPNDDDNVLRQVPLVFKLGNKLVPALAAEAVRVRLGSRLFRLQGTLRGRGMQALGVGSLVVQTDNLGRVWLRDERPPPGRYISAVDLLDGKVDREHVSGRIVLIGATATGLNDLRSMPSRPYMPGVEVHAELVEQLLDHAILSRPSWVHGITLVATIAAAIVLAAGLGFGLKITAVTAGLLLLADFGLTWFAFVTWKVLVDPILPGVTIALSMLLAWSATLPRTSEDG